MSFGRIAFHDGRVTGRRIHVLGLHSKVLFQVCKNNERVVNFEQTFRLAGIMGEGESENKNNNRNKKNNVFSVRALLNAQKTGANVNTRAPKSSPSLQKLQRCLRGHKSLVPLCFPRR